MVASSLLLQLFRVIFVLESFSTGWKNQFSLCKILSHLHYFVPWNVWFISFAIHRTIDYYLYAINFSSFVQWLLENSQLDLVIIGVLQLFSPWFVVIVIYRNTWSSALVLDDFTGPNWSLLNFNWKQNFTASEKIEWRFWSFLFRFTQLLFSINITTLFSKL